MFIIYDQTSNEILVSSTHEIPDAISNGVQVEISQHIANPMLYRWDPQTQNIVLKNNAQELVQNQQINHIRAQRNAKLTATDWTQMPDVALTQQQKDQWAAYRQALRDLMSTLPNPLPQGYRPTWPQKP